MKACVEVLSYRLKSEVAKEAYMEYVEKLQEALLEIEGFIKRDVYHNGESGVWVEMAEWSSLDAAKQAEETLMGQPFMVEAMKLIDESTSFMHYVEQIDPK